MTHLKTGHYYLAAEALNPALQKLIRQFGAEVSLITDEYLIITKTGTDDELLKLYNQMEGLQLHGFCKSTLPAGGQLMLPDNTQP